MTTNAGRATERPEEDALLDERVRPVDWRNPHPAERYDLVVVGGGTAGLVAAAGAAGLGARVALVERDRLGGDCLVTGCVPSKALLRSARAAAEVRRAPSLGVSGGPGEVDFGAAMRRMRRLRSELAVHDSAERFRALGVDVFLGEGRFVSHDAVAVGDDTLRFRRAILATGARPSLPAIEGLSAAAPLTSASFFDLADLPRRLAVVGAGPIGCELGQAMARLGSQVTLLGRAPGPLPREEPDAGVIVARALERDGVQVLASTELLRVESAPAGHLLRWRGSNGEGTTECDAILVAVGRTPNLDDLGLHAAGIETGPGGLVVDARLRTSNPRVWASGDVCLPDRFTHAADASSRMVLRNALFAGRARYSDLLVPHCTYTDPEVARVGLDPASADRAGVAIDTHEVPMSSVDRAVLDDDTEGFLRIHVRRGTDRILGATAVGAHAGDLVSSIVLAMEGRLGLARLSATIHPYPTRSDALRRVGDAYQRTRLTPFTKRLLSAWIRFRR
jgi:pyruvate/2-oxoglutarate dehydrogenase complex dihydrolipoamide dehydrogenase (E3) component